MTVSCGAEGGVDEPAEAVGIVVYKECAASRSAVAIKLSNLSFYKLTCREIGDLNEKGIKVSAEDLESYLPFWLRSDELPKWDITIIPA